MALTVRWRGSVLLNEQPESPEWNFTDRVACVQTFRGPYALARASAPLRGSLGTGEQLGMWVVESNVRKEKGGIGVLTVRYEGPAAGTLPLDEAEIKLEKVERALELHSRYASVTESLLADIKTVLESSAEHPDSVTAKARIVANTLANELYTKKRKGFTHYVIYAPVYKLLIHSWTTPGGLVVGGNRQAPPTVPLVPPTGIDWLREGDSVTWNGSMWAVEKRWLGSPDLDTDIYP